MIGTAHQSRSTSAQGLNAAVRTHPGLRRTQNEDDFVCDPAVGIFAVIDGIGGERGGEVAAKLTREALVEHAARNPEDALKAAHRAVRAWASADAALDGMGCVATTVTVRGGLARIAHVGDTRAWLVGQDGCQQLTRDHSVAAAARDRQDLTGLAESAPAHVVTRDIGGPADPSGAWADTLEVAVYTHDLIILATDGLHDVVPDAEILALLDDARSNRIAPAVLVDQLIELALTRGGPDNVTVLVVRVEEGGAKAEAKALPAGIGCARPLAFALGAAFLTVLALGVMLYSVFFRPETEAVPPLAPEPLTLLVPADTAVTLKDLHLEGGSALRVRFADPTAKLTLEHASLTIGALELVGRGGDLYLTADSHVQVTSFGQGEVKLHCSEGASLMLSSEGEGDSKELCE